MNLVTWTFSKLHPPNRNVHALQFLILHPLFRIE